MSKGLNDFIVKDWNGVPCLDINKARQIPLEEFRQKYIEEMQTYFDFNKVSTITCWDCHKNINSAEELFRYFGANLHKDCLRKRYEEDKKKKSSIIGKWEEEYFDFILESIENAPARN